jgi:hypothetical protein
MYDDVRYLFQSSSGIDTFRCLRTAWAEAIKDSFDVLGRILWSTDEVVGAVDMCDSEAGTIASVPVLSVSCARQGRNDIVTIRDYYASASLDLITIEVSTHSSKDQAR